VQRKTTTLNLGLKSQPKWSEYCNSGKKPADIPSSPNKVYASDGWAGIGDWLGTGRIAPGQFRPFQKARAYVRGLRLKSWVEWEAYCKSGGKPPDIPIHPHAAYAHVGWTGRLDWLTDNPRYRSFEKARSFVHALGLKSPKEWNAYCTSGKKPSDIPSGPSGIYADDGWAGMSDWLGTPSRKFRTFKEAQAYVRDLRLKSEAEWFAYCRSGKKPDDIPTGAKRVYFDDGWAGMGDWLGTVRAATHLVNIDHLKMRAPSCILFT
jgi:formylglycine-generating enzyme required for sulfatase activity